MVGRVFTLPLLASLKAPFNAPMLSSLLAPLLALLLTSLLTPLHAQVLAVDRSVESAVLLFRHGNSNELDNILLLLELKLQVSEVLPVGRLLAIFVTPKVLLEVIIIVNFNAPPGLSLELVRVILSLSKLNLFFLKALEILWLKYLGLLCLLQSLSALLDLLHGYICLVFGFLETFDLVD